MPATKHMTVNKKELLDLEKGFWTGDATYYAANADAECLVAFPQMAQAMSNADLAKSPANQTAGAISTLTSRAWSSRAAISSC